MNVLVTGGCGFIGWHFIQLAQQNPKIKKIINIDKLTYAATNAPRHVQLLNDGTYVMQEHYGIFAKADICNKKMLEDIMEKYDVDAVVNFAAETHVDNSIKSNAVFVHTNVRGTLNLLDTCKSLWGSHSQNKFVQVSTDEVFGHLHAGDEAFNENTKYNPRNPYSATKAAADHLVQAYGNTHNMNVAITHCSNNYGPGQHIEKLIPKTITNALQGKTIPVYGDGMQIRDWIYVEDHARGILQVLLGDSDSGEHFCIGASNEIRNLELVNVICHHLDNLRPLDNASHADLIEFVQDRPGHDKRYAINSSKMHKTFDWKPETTFSDGILKTIEHYLNK